MLISSKHKCFAFRYAEFKLLIAYTSPEECRPMLNAIWFNLARGQASVGSGSVGILAQVGTLAHDAPKGNNVFLERAIAENAIKAASRRSWIVVHIGRDNVKLSLRTTNKGLDRKDDPFLTMDRMLDGSTAAASIDTEGNGARDHYPRSCPPLELLIGDAERAEGTDRGQFVAFNPYLLRVLTHLDKICANVHLSMRAGPDQLLARAMSRDDSDTLWALVVMPMRVQTPPIARTHAPAPKPKKRRSAA